MHSKGRQFVRDLVRVRDNFTCKDCGIRRTPYDVWKHNKRSKTLKGRIKNLDVHHINGMCGKNSKGYDRISKIDTLITLCHKCHYNRPEHKCQSDEWKTSFSRNYNGILKMRTKGLSLSEIGKHFGVSRERVRQVIKRLTETKKTTN